MLCILKKVYKWLPTIRRIIYLVYTMYRCRIDVFAASFIMYRICATICRIFVTMCRIFVTIYRKQATICRNVFTKLLSIFIIHRILFTIHRIMFTKHRIMFTIQYRIHYTVYSWGICSQYSKETIRSNLRQDLMSLFAVRKAVVVIVMTQQAVVDVQ